VAALETALTPLSQRFQFRSPSGMTPAAAGGGGGGAAATAAGASRGWGLPENAAAFAALPALAVAVLAVGAGLKNCIQKRQPRWASDRWLLAASMTVPAGAAFAVALLACAQDGGGAPGGGGAAARSSNLPPAALIGFGACLVVAAVREPLESPLMRNRFFFAPDAFLPAAPRSAALRRRP
jgi:hypothetical protein